MAATLPELCRFSASVIARDDKMADKRFMRLHAVELYGILTTAGELLLGPSASIICAHIHSVIQIIHSPAAAAAQNQQLTGSSRHCCTLGKSYQKSYFSSTA